MHTIESRCFTTRNLTRQTGNLWVEYYVSGSPRTFMWRQGLLLVSVFHQILLLFSFPSLLSFGKSSVPEPLSILSAPFNWWNKEANRSRTNQLASRARVGSALALHMACQGFPSAFATLLYLYMYIHPAFCVGRLKLKVKKRKATQEKASDRNNDVVLPHVRPSIWSRPTTTC